MGYAIAREVQRELEQPATIKGGFVMLQTIEVCMAWSLYTEGQLRALDVRVWLAAKEMAERRKHAGASRRPRYCLEELGRLVGGGGGRSVRGSLRRLGRVGLVRWSESQVTFARSPEELSVEDLEPIWAMYRLMPPKRSRVALPRRMLRVVAGGVKRAVLATVLAEVLWCLYYHRRRGWSSEGNCKASWVAAAFGLSERSIIRARRHLEELRWLERVEMPQWHMNRYGARYVVNLSWARLDATAERSKLSTNGPEETPDEVSGLSGPLARNGTGLSGPESDRTLSSRCKNQKPARRGPAGLSKEGGAGEPTLRNVVPEDLADVGRLLALFEQATGRDLVGGSELDRLNFVGAAEHARARGSSNPCGLFYWLVSRGRFEHITQDDEDGARRRLKEHLYGEPLRVRDARVREEQDDERAIGSCMSAVLERLGGERVLPSSYASAR